MAIKNTLAIADSYGQMSARIKLAINDMSEYDYVQNRLLKTANATKEAYQRLKAYSSIQVGTSEISGTP